MVEHQAAHAAGLQRLETELSAEKSLREAAEGEVEAARAMSEEMQRQAGLAEAAVASAAREQAVQQAELSTARATVSELQEAATKASSAAAVREVATFLLIICRHSLSAGRSAVA